MAPKTILSCVFVTLLFGTAQGDQLISSGAIYDVYMTEGYDVGQWLKAYDITVVNTTGDVGFDPHTFDGVSSGHTGIVSAVDYSIPWAFHQHYSSMLGWFSPTDTSLEYATIIDTHFTNAGENPVIVSPMDEDYIWGSTEPSDARSPFDAFADTDFGSYLTGAFSLDPSVSVDADWQLAHVVVEPPFRPLRPVVPGNSGSIFQLNFYVGGTNGGETVDVTLGLGWHTNADFDGDGDVDADDIDRLVANFGHPAYDLNEDGNTDEDDFVVLVEDYVEYDIDGDGTPDGTGSYRGDFNLDGTVNGTDLSILAGGFGTAAGYGSGNANGDSIVDGTDLSILASNFGNVATAAIPEPATMSLLVLGGLAMLRRRKS